jgi:rubrerythrin
MVAKKKVAGKSKWTCKECGKPSNGAGKVCMVCRTENTVIKGSIKKKASPPKAAAKSPAKAVKTAAVSKKIRDPGMCDALARALDLEREGRALYLKCAEKTGDSAGKSMFTYLANEEKIHYDKIAQLYEHEDFKGYCEYVEATGLTSGIFDKKAKGVTLDGKSDTLDALNLGIRAEENSIDLYIRLADDASSEDMRVFFEHLVAEERKHRSILENEIEFVTETGDFKDFKIITM